MSCKIIRRTFPQVYEIDRQKSGVYWLVSARRKKYGFNERKTFSAKARALEHAGEIEKQFLSFGAQTEVPKEKIIKAENYEQLSLKVGPFGVSLEDAVEHFVQQKAAELFKQSKPFIRDLVEQWKVFKFSKKGLSDRFQVEIKSYARFIKRQWGDLKPDDLKKNEIELMLNKLDVSNNTRRKYLLIIRMFLKWLVDEGHLSKKPTDGIRIIADGYNGDFYTPAETKQLLQFILKNNKELIGYYALLTFAGLRPNIMEAEKWCFGRSLKSENPFTDEYVRKLHKEMFCKTWKWAGMYRNTEKTIGVPAFKIREMLKVLLDDAEFWIKEKTFEPHELALRFHHRIVSIHPFPNGNGRHARLMADVIIKRLGLDRFRWGNDNLAEVGSMRTAYIHALKCADGGDIQPLMKFAI